MGDFCGVEMFYNDEKEEGKEEGKEEEEKEMEIVGASSTFKRMNDDIMMRGNGISIEYELEKHNKITSI